MKRVLVTGVSLVVAAAGLAGCSDDKGGSDNPGNTKGVSSGGDASVTVDGKDLSGLDMDTVTCVKSGGKITIASGSAGGQSGLGAVMTDEDPPVVESVALVVDGTALGVAAQGGVSTGSAEVSVDGDEYTITGEAEGADMNNPTAGLIKKEFEIKVTCN